MFHQTNRMHYFSLMIRDQKGKVSWNVSRFINHVSLTNISFCFLAQFANTIYKREQFAVSLRKKKKDQIIKDKRRKIQNRGLSEVEI